MPIIGSYEIQLRIDRGGKITWESVRTSDNIIYRYPDERSAWNALASYYPTVLTMHCNVLPTAHEPNMGKY